jgi:SAM-dependent methyltransferase
MVDEGWGRRAVDFATLSEPGNCREYVAMHHRLGVDAGDRLLDVACGSGLAIELAGLRGASCAGIDASARLVAVARDRSPDADIRVGDMNAPPSSRPRGSYAMACRSGPTSTSWATWPANPKEQNAHDRQLSRRTHGVGPSAGALQR